MPKRKSGPSTPKGQRNKRRQIDDSQKNVENILNKGWLCYKNF